MQDPTAGAWQSKQGLHPQADALERAFARMTGSQGVVTDGGQQEKCLLGGRLSQLESTEDSKDLVSREGIEPPTY